MSDSKDLFLDDILSETNESKKRVKGKSKGNRTELNLCKFLTNKMGYDFVRSVGSGNRWSQANLSETAKQVYSGDICVPEGFKWVIECKGGYEDDMNLTNVCEGVACLDGFIEQVKKDSEYCGRKPIILWKRNRKPWISMVRLEDMPDMASLDAYIYYKGWVIIHFDKLLEITEKEFWFEKKNSNN